MCMNGVSLIRSPFERLEMVLNEIGDDLAIVVEMDENDEGGV